MEFEWDRRKVASNLRKHGIDFADAATVLDDPMALTLSEHREGEERFASMGVDAQGRTLVVINTWREDSVRLISAREAAPTERRRYEETP